MVGKHLSRSAVGGLRIWCEIVNELQDFLAPGPTRLVPEPVGQDAGGDHETQRRKQAQLPGSCKRPCSKQKSRRRYRQTNLASENGCEQHRVAMPYNELNDCIHC